ncbi:MAG: hypothetical protein LBR20_02190 [Propionibacteriaceae bacterium]|jgi:hypothetical protein|nr:hypothetical protein [Propionibacteriaceae bacterium]
MMTIGKRLKDHAEYTYCWAVTDGRVKCGDCEMLFSPQSVEIQASFGGHPETGYEIRLCAELRGNPENSVKDCFCDYTSIRKARDDGEEGLALLMEQVCLMLGIREARPGKYVYVGAE